MTDASAQASPLQPAVKLPVVDGSLQASPAIGPLTSLRSGRTRELAPGTALHVALERSIDSGHLLNGQNLHARLTEPVRTESGEVLPVGSPVEINVVETLAAGVLSAEGEFSLQVERVGAVDVATNTETFRGKPGARDVADSAPSVGTDAGLAAGAPLTFRVLPPPMAAETVPEESAITPGSVDGVASGGPPPAGTRTNTGEPRFGGGFGGHKPVANARIVAPANDSFGPVQHRGQAGGAPNQIGPATSGVKDSSTGAH